MLYSKSTNGFYDSAIHGKNIPLDAVEITSETWQMLLSDQSKGKIIQADGNGFPISIDRPVLTVEQTIGAISSSIKLSIDAVAKKWGYDNIVSAASYANSSNKQYSADAAALISWRDAVWVWATQLFPSVVAGQSPDEFMKNMPAQPAQPKATQ